MKLEYDPEADAAYLRLRREIEPASVARTVPVDPTEVDGEIYLDFDKDGRLVGIEMQSASRYLDSSLLRRSTSGENRASS